METVIGSGKNLFRVATVMERNMNLDFVFSMLSV